MLVCRSLFSKKIQGRLKGKVRCMCVCVCGGGGCVRACVCVCLKEGRDKGPYIIPEIRSKLATLTPQDRG